MSSKVKLHFIVPVHNESEGLEEKIQNLSTGLAKKGGGNVYLVENGSSDHSWTICNNLQKLSTESLKIIPIQILDAGLGLALKAGALKALEESKSTNDLFIFTAADLPFGFSDLESYFAPEFYREGMVGAGSKQHPQSQANRDFKRRFASYFFRILRTILLNLPLWDSQGSIIAPREVVARIINKVQSRDYFFTTEFFYYSAKDSFLITELPVIMDKERRPSKVHIIKDSFRMLRQMLSLALKIKN